VIESLFTTITNANFDDTALMTRVKQTVTYLSAIDVPESASLPESARWTDTEDDHLLSKATLTGTLNQSDEDVRSLVSLALFGLS